jgi:hypothetical protein
MISDPFRRSGYAPDRLNRIAKSEEFRVPGEPPVRLGDVVQLNSGGPRCLVVDLLDFNNLAVSWRDSEGMIYEDVFPAPCVHPMR